MNDAAELNQAVADVIVQIEEHRGASMDEILARLGVDKDEAAALMEERWRTYALSLEPRHRTKAVQLMFVKAYLEGMLVGKRLDA